MFPEFAEAIKNKFNRPQYGGLLFGNVWIVGFLDCKVDETCTPGTGPSNNEELTPRYPGAEIIQRSMYSGYRQHVEVERAFDGTSARACIMESTRGKHPFFLYLGIEFFLT